MTSHNEGKWVLLILDWPQLGRLLPVHARGIVRLVCEEGLCRIAAPFVPTLLGVFARLEWRGRRDARDFSALQRERYLRVCRVLFVLAVLLDGLVQSPSVDEEEQGIPARCSHRRLPGEL